MADRHVERALRFGDVVHAVTQPAIGEAVLAHVEAVAFAAEQIVGRHLQILDLDLGVAAVDRRRHSGPSIAMFATLRLIL